MEPRSNTTTHDRCRDFLFRLRPQYKWDTVRGIRDAPRRRSNTAGGGDGALSVAVSAKIKLKQNEGENAMLHGLVQGEKKNKME